MDDFGDFERVPLKSWHSMNFPESRGNNTHKELKGLHWQPPLKMIKMDYRSDLAGVQHSNMYCKVISLQNNHPV